MKKWIVGTLAAVTVFSLTACGNVSDETKDEAKEKVSSKAEDVKEKAKSKADEMKKEGSAKLDEATQKLHTKAMDFYTDLVDKVNEKDKDYDAYIADITSDAPSKGAKLDELAEKASASAENISETLANVKVPDLGERTDAFKTSIQSLSDAFAEKAAAIKANPGDTKAAEKADAAIQNASDKLSEALKNIGLAGSNIVNDITG
ncbi:hypothetical protein BMT55_04820 [Listeria newyorkensis]|uniref:Lipoprotein n=1 Tax=Listeria newyorkensis TaxID=1497681 RepID=A0A841YSG8_9LIST|nr:hypothetical protein [Listeria newyorkensis]KGL40037.1 hypothetical protein EP58_12840 [Listeria newyorkensis]MBC1456340.1 hypothetical protein [Listeria newyorkensis]PNP93320.1 hypothetical protein BMT55_04820 [Listeria newyorkensis]WAO21236.1 hypothetical protein OTR81_13350 [Listeria newyorkensis]SQC55719.1 Uncharacterised protein [Listeria newyorkensis]